MANQLFPGCYDLLVTLTARIGLSVAGALFLVAISLLALYGASDSYVAEDSLLVEEFWALALGSFALLGATFVGLLTGVISVARMIIRKRQQTEGFGLSADKSSKIV